jgi:hypothetical protein
MVAEGTAMLEVSSEMAVEESWAKPMERGE